MTEDRLAEIKRRKLTNMASIALSHDEFDWLISELEETRRKMLAYARKAGRLERDLMDCRMEAQHKAERQ